MCFFWPNYFNMEFRFNLPSDSLYVESVLITFIYLKPYRLHKVARKKIPSIFMLMLNAHLKYFLKNLF